MNEKQVATKGWQVARNTLVLQAVFSPVNKKGPVNSSFGKYLDFPRALFRRIFSFSPWEPHNEGTQKEGFERS